MRNFNKIMTMAFVIVIALAVLTGTTWAKEVKDEITSQTVMIDKAVSTLNTFVADKDMGWFRKHIGDSYGIIIMPQLIKGGFIWAGAGGRGVLVARDELTGKWSEPVFLTTLGMSWGLQIGGQTSEAIMLVRSRRGLESFYTSSINLGAQASIAVGPVGATGAVDKAPTLKADYLTWAKSKGAFGGLSFEGSNVRIDNKWNKEYYGRDVRPVEIIVTREVTNPKSAKLVEAVKRAGKVD